MQFELFPSVYIVCYIKLWKKKKLITLLYETAKRFHTVWLGFFFSYLHETKKILFIT